MATSENIQQLYEAKAAVMRAVPYVRKASRMRNPGGGDDIAYVSESDLLSRIRPAMLNNQVFLAPVRVEDINIADSSTKAGDRKPQRRFLVTYRVTHGPSQQWEEIQVPCESSTPGDKCSTIAMTGGYKLALRQWLMIETGEDPERYVDVDETNGHEVESGQGLVALGSRASDAYDAIQKASGPEALMNIQRHLQKVPLDERDRQFLTAEVNRRLESTASLTSLREAFDNEQQGTGTDQPGTVEERGGEAEGHADGEGLDVLSDPFAPGD